ncbi:thymidylate synthase [Patescibacteria group bacterium]|nr:thymidylate synthase [Patescibacteria group bacterium]MBU1931596.1 thymidylate synthase [Patescibacteria group bacterium]
MLKQAHPEQQYLNLLQDILDNGVWKISHSTGVKLKSVFGRQLRFDLSQSFPLLTTKKTFFRGIVHELLWFLSGSPNIKYLIDNNVHIWDEYPYKNYKLVMEQGKVPELTFEQFMDKMKSDSKFVKKWGDIGPVYGVQWRRWPAGDGREIDQLGWVLKKIKEKPQKKHYVVSAWNAANIYEMAATRKESMAIAPCHTLFHIVLHDGKLCLQLYQRSADVFLGVPFNIASYALLTVMLAQVAGYPPGDFVHTFGDVHIYENHFDQVKEQLTRKPRQLPVLKLNPKINNIDDFKFDDIKVEGYKPYPTIKASLTPVGGF